MKKIVMYNGRCNNYFCSTDPSVLQKGCLYRVEEEIDYGYYTEYRLVGVEGEFNSVWFNSVEKLKFAYAENSPEVEERMRCDEIMVQEGRISFVKCETDILQSVERVYNNIYVATTEDEVYVISCQ